MKKQIKCKKCGYNSILVFGSKTYYCGNGKCPYFELLPKGIKKYEQGNFSESVAHFVTVIGTHATMSKDGWYTHGSYEKAIQYTLEFIKYRFNPKNIK